MSQQNFSLSIAINSLVQGILNYESDTFSASRSKLTLQKAEMMAAQIIHNDLFNQNGVPQGGIDGNTIGYAMDEVDEFLEKQTPST